MDEVYGTPRMLPVFRPLGEIEGLMAAHDESMMVVLSEEQKRVVEDLKSGWVVTHMIPDPIMYWNSIRNESINCGKSRS